MIRGYVIEEDGRWFVERIPGKGDVFGRLKEARLFATVGSALTYIEGMCQKDEYGNGIARYIWEVEVKRNENENSVHIIRHWRGSGYSHIGRMHED